MKKYLLYLYLTGIALSVPSVALAQIDPDRSLPRNSIIQRQNRTTIITGGTEAGNNLFHSFRQFSVSNGRTASFRGIRSNIENIFTRITGSSASRIDGLVEALGTDGAVSSANFFLLNPNGILFGPRAELNIGGSFVATTARQIDFADGTQFRADAPQSSPLLTMSVPVGLQFGRSPGAIVNRSVVESDLPLLDPGGNPVPVPKDEADSVVGLRVNSGRTLALLGGNITLITGEVTAPDGRIELSSIQSADRVNLTPHINGWRFDYGGVREFGEIRLEGTDDLFSDVDASGAGGGTIRLQSNRLSLTPNTLIRSDTYGKLNGQEISINANQITSFGDITANTFNVGNGGDINIQSDQMTLNFGFISANTFEAGDGGNISIRTDQLTILNSGQIAANTTASGRGGDISISAADFIDLLDIERNASGEAILKGGAPIPSGIFARVDEEAATGRSGNISITTDRLRLLAGGQISSDTSGAGNAGAIIINANNVEISDVARLANGEPILTEGLPGYPSALSTFSEESAQGRAGNIRITTARLQIRDGAVIQSSTQGSGDAGNLNINAVESIELVGGVDNTQGVSSLFTFSGGIPEVAGNNIENPRATGAAGNLTITTRELQVGDGAIAAVGSFNPNSAVAAGNLRVTADTVRLEGQAALYANTNSGNGGQSTFRIADLLLLRRGSRISTTAGTAKQGGNGGDINIDANIILSSLSENNDITANAFSGNGGNVNITAQSIFGILPQSEATPRSDITARSERGIDGTIQIDALDLNPAQGLIELPSTIVDASSLIAQTCPTNTADTNNLSEFVVTGRGGLPPSPTDPRDDDALLTDWATLEERQEPPDEEKIEYRGNRESDKSHQTETIVEAQGWRIGSDGKVILTTQATDTLPQGSIFIETACRN